MKIRVAAPLQFDSIVDGPGLRMVLWTQGCIHRCPGCHNPQTHDLCGGSDIECAEIIEKMKQSNLQRGITFSGGDPLLQPAGLLPIAKAAKEMGFDVWAYTGFVWEMLMDTKHVNYQEIQALLPYIDVLVDGRFIERKKRAGLRFRGSSNQRIIDVPSSLKKGQVVLAEEYMH
ncbi:anaerobic ribonucleoside-triphosphate reductase activating protein [Bacillus testis]|uniref:anaerobic ribonucleoside-triphosphate reductase activating protein n=1 Tax=Bacillus testis TaxID=1622072 RepID=UPI00067E980B|nr:anaerobic ribonucleoside-triphosphate reductase activating protein [Bacillus testis]